MHVTNLYTTCMLFAVVMITVLPRLHITILYLCLGAPTDVYTHNCFDLPNLLTINNM